jgi:Peptidase inhibitor family I36
MQRSRRVRHRLPPAVSCLLLVAGSVAATGGTARAAVTDCPAEEVCVWSGANYTGAATVIQDETCDNAAVHSAANNDPDTLQQLRVFAQPGCAGAVTVVGHGMRMASLDGRSYQNWHDPADPIN